MAFEDPNIMGRGREVSAYESTDDNGKKIMVIDCPKCGNKQTIDHEGNIPCFSCGEQLTVDFGGAEEIAA